MKPAHKGLLLGMLAGIAITIAWATATTGREGDCIDPGRSWIDGCQCEPIGAGTFAAVGLTVIVPCMMIAGSMLGALAMHLYHRRVLVFAAIANTLALLLAGVASMFRQCTSDPSTTTLVQGALVPLLVATLVLERATRPEPVVARARIHERTT